MYMYTYMDMATITRHNHYKLTLERGYINRSDKTASDTNL